MNFPTLIRKFRTTNFVKCLSLAPALMICSCATLKSPTFQESAGIGTTVGAGIGAIIGSQSGSAGAGTAIGAGSGLLIGSIVGSALFSAESERAELEKQIFSAEQALLLQQKRFQEFSKQQYAKNRAMRSEIDSTRGQVERNVWKVRALEKKVEKHLLEEHDSFDLLSSK